MKRTTTLIALLLVICPILFSYDLPKNWFKAGSEPDKYDMGIDKGKGMNGKNAAIIKSNSKKIRGFGTLMQNAMPDKYLGKRVRMSGYMKSENVDNWAGFWFRVDGAEKGSLAFDNMHDRCVKGTTDWTKYEIVLDVSAKATNLAYGALIGGTGTIWFDDIKFEIVENSTKATGRDVQTPDKPTNLNFEE
jgi:hypothetical protein